MIVDKNYVQYGIKSKLFDKNIEYFDSIYDSPKMVSFQSKDKDIYELVFEIHEDQTDFCKYKNDIEYFSYIEDNFNKIGLIYPNIKLFSMCFPDGYESEIEKVYHLKLISSKLIIKKEIYNENSR